jgi:hypothetical protein
MGIKIFLEYVKEVWFKSWFFWFLVLCAISIFIKPLAYLLFIILFVLIYLVIKEDYERWKREKRKYDENNLRMQLVQSNTNMFVHRQTLLTIINGLTEVHKRLRQILVQKVERMKIRNEIRFATLQLNQLISLARSIQEGKPQEKVEKAGRYGKMQKLHK